MPLTDLAIRRAKPGDKRQKWSDCGDLYLLLQPTGARYWGWEDRVTGNEKLLAFGNYPDVPLALARQRREDTRQLACTGCRPRRAQGIRDSGQGRTRRQHIRDLRPRVVAEVQVGSLRDLSRLDQL